LVVTWAYNAGTNTATASGAGSTNFAALVAADTAGGWGKFTADATGTQIICNAKIVVGDGTNACVFSDSAKQILNNGFDISVSVSSTLTWGTLDDATDRTTSNGCHYIANFGGVTHQIDGAGTVNLYGCNLICVKTFSWIGLSLYQITKLVMYNCTTTAVVIQGCGTASKYYNVENNGGPYYPFYFVSTPTLMDKCKILGFSGNSAIYAGDVCSLSNVYVRNCTNLITMQVWVHDRRVSLIDADTDIWSITWAYAGGFLDRKYTFDLTTNAGATVTLKDNTGATVFTETTATGTITTQTVTRGYYHNTTGDTLQDYAPHTLTITKAGKDIHTETLTLTEKTKLQITLETPTVSDLSQPTWAITKAEYDKIVKDEAEPYMMATAVLLLQRQRDKRMIRAMSK
jgi:hypothetical protein